MVDFKSRWMNWTPENPNYLADNGAISAFVSNGSALSKDFPIDATEQPDALAVRYGSPLQQLANSVRDERLIADKRNRARDIQRWLRDHMQEHMATSAPGLPAWWSNVLEFEVIENQLDRLFGFVGCIWIDRPACPNDAPVVCRACEGPQSEQAT